MPTENWWKNAIGYQIYPKSFLDTNGDGIGDLRGIQAKIPYLQKMGIDFVWLSSIFQSPQIDNGYDVVNFTAVDPAYGTLADFEALLTALHEADIRLVLDVSFNDTSSQHPWFEQARTSKSSPFHDYYIWRDPVNSHEPNNWESEFGGSAWAFNELTGEYYYHLFTDAQPDLNWENQRVRKEIYEVIRFWAAKGIDGLRLDNIFNIKKLTTFENVMEPNQAYQNVSGIERYFDELKAVFDETGLMTIAEASSVPMESAAKQIDGQNGIFDMLYQFDHLGSWHSFDMRELGPKRLKSALSNWQNHLGQDSWNALFIEDHDLPRAVSSFGNDGVYRRRSAKAIGLMYFMMKGTPFLYQGQELGMTNAKFQSITDYRDFDSLRYYDVERAAGVDEEQILTVLAKRSRDNARTPMQWNNEKNGGFSKAQPWLPVNTNYPTVNVEDEQNNPYSVLTFYETMIRLKKQTPALSWGKYDLIQAADDHLYVYRRSLNGDQWLVVTNLSSHEVEYDDLKLAPSELIFTNATPDPISDDPILLPWEARLYHLRAKG